MTTNADAIAALVESKSALQAQCDAASGDTLRQLISTIHNISDEIGALEAAVLNNAITSRRPILLRAPPATRRAF